MWKSTKSNQSERLEPTAIKFITDLFLSLVTAAIGSVVQCRSFREVQETRPDTIYIERALSILPVVNMEFSLRSVQCLVMLTIYYNCIMKPCQAHDYILMASFKAQGLFKWRCTTAITISHDKEVYASVIAHELARQLDTWYDRLPESLRFDRTIDQGAQNTAVLSPSSEIPGLTTATKSLKMQYYLCLTGIFWPAVYSAVYVDNIGSEASR
ncbi:hypothetical protein M7I_8185 [Glarea lozoyensis 74030]|uniref:Uncharacterized protein n=1 Tax=Glarea lozoyensis (strain ATCC 74030 / MF5533) TaxID=1104152 RepID=H0EZC2_GLAL7|nr:hypothetical protein M7I_8185 [Glarea lozoyensis 74030]